MKAAPKKSIGRFLLDNWDNAIAMVICAAAGVYGLFGGKPADPWLLTAVTWALGLVAFGSIKDREARKDLQNHIETLKKKPTPADVLLNRSGFQRFEKVSANAQEINLFGASLVIFLGGQQNHLENLILRHGAHVRVLVLDESADVIESAALCLDMKKEELVQEIALTKTIIQNIASEVQASKGSIELRKTRVFPNYGLTMIDPTRPGGFMTVEFNGFQEKSDLRPHIELTKAGDPIWFDLYLNDFNLLWDRASVCASGGRPPL